MPRRSDTEPEARLETALRRIVEQDTALAAGAARIEQLSAEALRFQHQSEERNAELAILQSVGEAMSKTLDVKTVTRIVGDKVRDIFGAEVTEILLREPGSDLIHVPYAFAKDYQEVEPFAMGEGVTSKVILSGQPIVFGSIEAGITLGALMPTAEDMTESYIGVPITSGAQALGVVSVQSYTPNAFNDGHVRLLHTLAANMGTAIANARLFDETQRLLEETEERNAELAILQSVGEAMAKTLDVKTVTRIVGDKVRDIFGAEFVDILLLEPGSEMIHVPYSFAKGHVEAEPFALGSGLTSKVIISGKPLIFLTMAELLAGGALMPTEEDLTESYIGVPIFSGAQTLGVVSVQSYTPNSFNDGHVRLLQTLAANMGTAIANARLFDETQRLLKITEERNAELAFLNGVQDVLVSNIDMQAIYDQIGDKIAEIFDAQVVDIGLFNPEDNLLHFPYAIEAGERFPDEPMGLIGFRKHVMETKAPLMFNEDIVGAAARFGNPLAVQGANSKSVLYVPMIVEGQARGVISLQNLDQEHAFDDSDLSLLTTIANATSIAIEKARLFTETQRLLKVTEDRAAELGAIAKVSEALIAEAELDSTIQLIGRQMQEIFDADIVYVALLDPKTNIIHFPFQIGETFDTLMLGEGLTSKIIETGEPLIINQNVDAMIAEVGATSVGKEALSYLGVPIKTTQGTIGVISVQSTTQEGIFTEDSLRLLTTIAANAGAALHNAQLFSTALEHLRQVEILTNAANAIEARSFEPSMVDSVAARTDALGELARVFRTMAQEVRVREQRLRRQLQQLQLDIEEKQQASEETLAVYIPMDRRQVMAHGGSLPETTRGTALFADITGFTALTEQLASELGLHRGAEEIIRHLNRVFTVLIDEVHRFGGCVIGFCGDAITCWFDDFNIFRALRPGPSPERAVAAALAMQRAMGAFNAIATPSGKTIGLAIKIAVATGPARRFVVGSGSGHEIDVVAGGTLNLLADAEQMAERGDIVLAATGLPDLDHRFEVLEWRGNRAFAVIKAVASTVSAEPWPELTPNAVAESTARPWLLPAVLEKVRLGKSGLLSELRPVTALFLNFSGTDFDGDPQAADQFDRFIRWVEATIAPLGGSLIQVTVGDKGNYLYVAFGAPLADQDAPVHAVEAALQLGAPPPELDGITAIRIGVAAGQMRVGAYGGTAHRTYGALGDKTNLAARLMMLADVSARRSAILCDSSVVAIAQSQFAFGAPLSARVKGKTEPISVSIPIHRLRGAEAAGAKQLMAAAMSTLPIDRLAPAEQLTLKVASVIGLSFEVETLSAVYPEVHDPEVLQIHLDILSGHRFIQPPEPGSSTYRFANFAIRDAAYEQMLFAQRRQLHRAMAELLEKASTETPLYGEIARHWQASDEIAKAVAFFERAGNQAHAEGRFDEASAFFTASLGLNA